MAISAPSFLNEPIEYGKSFSRGIRVNFDNYCILFISGTASVNHKGQTCHIGDFSAQAKRTFANITGLLKSEGASWNNVVKTRCYLKDMSNYKKFNICRNQFYKRMKLNPFPASVCVQVTLCRPELLVEIEAVAIVKFDKKK